MIGSRHLGSAYLYVYENPFVRLSAGFKSIFNHMLSAHQSVDFMPSYIHKAII
jgi:hypothetical protein